jgi:hypothetical protein
MRQMSRRLWRFYSCFCLNGVVSEFTKVQKYLSVQREYALFKRIRRTRQEYFAVHGEYADRHKFSLSDINLAYLGKFFTRKQNSFRS